MAGQIPAYSSAQMEETKRLSISCRNGRYISKDVVPLEMSVSFHQYDWIFSDMPLRCPGLKVEFDKNYLPQILDEAEKKFDQTPILVKLRINVVGKISWSKETESPRIRVIRVLKKGPWFFETIGIGNRGRIRVLDFDNNALRACRDLKESGFPSW